MYTRGRTETIRSCSNDSLEFSRGIDNPGLSLHDKFKLMKKAIDTHKAYANEAVRGFGVDRHLLGLKKIAAENGIEIPALFQDPGYIQSTHFKLSTSQVNSKLIMQEKSTYINEKVQYKVLSIFAEIL